MTPTGCCADKSSCTEGTCMKLPEGSTCGQCRSFQFCNKLFGAAEDRTHCDFFPRRFKTYDKK